MEWLDDVTATKLICVFEKSLKPLYDSSIFGPVIRKHDPHALFVWLMSAEGPKKSPDFLINVSKELMCMAKAISDLGSQEAISLGMVKIEALPAMDMEEIGARMAQGQVADLVHCVCLLLATRYLNRALALKVQKENCQFGGH